ncbi:MAG: hypothetical protein IVW53_14540 [Chloroflexi bacterium]|nr:hypothetical protein [Chloroflexota bacterium]MBF6606783.1 hypothetical protein [Chloroflexota bacterium]
MATISVVTVTETLTRPFVAIAGVLGIPIVVTNDAKWQGAIATAALSLGLCHLDAHLPL